MNKLSKIFLLLLLTASCDDILLNDLSGDTMTLLAPSDGHEVAKGQPMIFWWEQLKGATEYELVVASPDVTNPQVMALDTVITKNQFVTTIPAGSYQWCLRARNSEYKTEFACRNFSVAN
jgi:hypothetical protein